MLVNKIKKNIKVVERPLMRVLNEFWYDRGTCDIGSLVIGTCFNISAGLTGLDNQVYLSMLDVNNLQDEFESVSSTCLIGFENAVNMLLIIEASINFQCSVLVHDLVAVDTKI